MKYRFLIINLFLFLFYSLTDAQIKTISGIVADSTTNARLPGVTVVAVSKIDNKIITGTTTDTNGRFRLKNINAGSISIKFSMIGYQAKHIDSLRNNYAIDLGTVLLNSSSVLLSEVEIKGQKRMIEYQADKKIINMDKVPGNTGSVSDALRNTGIVEVDPLSKKISFRGNSSINIMIDGRPVSGADLLLAQMPASNVEKVEIITNPSAKEDPEGEAGILNIITKKNQFDNLNGSASLYGSTQRTGFGNLILNYKNSNFNFYSSFSGYLGNENSSRLSARKINYKSNSFHFLNSEGETNVNANSEGLRLGMDYDIDAVNIIALTGSFNKMKYDINNPANSVVYNSANMPEYNYLLINGTDVNTDSYNYTAYYRRRLNSKGSEITIDGYYLKQDNTTNADLSAQYNYMPLSPALQNTDIHTRNNTWIVKSDLILHTDNYGKFEAGLRSTIRNRENSYNYLNYNYKSQYWTDSMNLSSLFKYKETIHALYLTYSNKINILDLKAGFRIEQTYSNGNTSAKENMFSSDYLSLFPSFSLSCNITDRYQISFNASRRITRPQIEYINPFVRVNGPNNIYKGNPLISPTYINLYELSFNPFLKIYFNDAKGKPVNFTVIENDSISVSSYINSAHSKTIGAEITVPLTNETGSILRLPDWFMSANISFSYYRLNEQAAYQNDSYSISRDNFRMNGNFDVKLWYDINASLYVMYTPETRDERFSINSRLYSGLQFTKSFMNRKLQLSFGIDDLFHSMQFKNETNAEDFYSFSNIRMVYTPGLSFSVRYNFNDFKRKAERTIDDGRDKPENSLLNNQ